MAGQAGLGNLNKLPAELRNIVYKHFIPQAPGSDVSYKARRKTRNHLAILRASRAVCSEITKLLYKNQDLIFTVSPDPYKARIAASMRHDHRGLVKLPLLDVPVGTITSDSVIDQVNDGSKTFVKYKQLPVHRLRRIFVELKPPNIDEPAEVIVCRSCVKWIVRLLSEGCGRLPPVHVVAVESNYASWCFESRLKTSIALPGPIKHGSDLEYLLIPFSELEDTQSTAICLHTSWQVRCNLLSDVGRTGSLRFLDTGNSCRLTNQPSCARTALQINFQELYRFERAPEAMLDVWFDCQLDDLPGDRAAMLRLDRYRSWSMQYEMKFLSLIEECSSI